MGPGAPCPTNPPPPSHLKVMQGIAKPELQAWASSIVNDPTATFGQLFERQFGPKPVTARVEYHSWTTHGAEIIPGCFKGVTLYEPKHPDTATAGEGELPPSTDTYFFPMGDGQWCGFPSGEILDTEDLPFEAKDPDVAIASGFGSFAMLSEIRASKIYNDGTPDRVHHVPQMDACAAARLWSWELGDDWEVSANTADGRRTMCHYMGGVAGKTSAYSTGQLLDIPSPSSPYGAFPSEPVTRDEAFAAAQQLASMYPNLRTVVAQAPDGFYVRVITLGGGLGGRGFGGYGSLFGSKGLRRQPAGRGSDWGDVFRTMDRIPSQIGRVRVEIDRLVSPDFAVGGVGVGSDIPIDEVRAAQDQLRVQLLDRCKCVLGWMRGVGLNCTMEMCGPGSKQECSVVLLVDGSKMSDEARAMVPPYVGRVPVSIRDIGDGPVPRFMEIVAP
jgi:hypothetical protein